MSQAFTDRGLRGDCARSAADFGAGDWARWSGAEERNGVAGGAGSLGGERAV